jgi:hypothetical protein
VEMVLSLLNLTSCRHTRVGDAVNRGISGGERRRLSLGEALMGDHAVTCFDEVRRRGNGSQEDERFQAGGMSMRKECAERRRDRWTRSQPELVIRRKFKYPLPTRYRSPTAWTRPPPWTLCGSSGPGPGTCRPPRSCPSFSPPQRSRPFSTTSWCFGKGDWSFKGPPRPFPAILNLNWGFPGRWAWAWRILCWPA